jgi:iron complex transport system substrate-binding protein
MRSTRPRRWAGTAVALTLAAVASGCGADTSQVAAVPTSTTGPPESSPVLPTQHTNPDGAAVAVADTTRIVVLNGDIAEVVWALDLGDSVVATDTSATYPAAAAALQTLGYQRSLSAEGILAQRPTVVIGSTDAGPPAVLDQVQAAGVPVVIIEAQQTLAAPANKIRAAGAALGVPNRAAALAAQVDHDIQQIVGRAEQATEQPRLATLYLRGANTQLLFGNDQGADAVAAAVGALPAVTVETTAPLTAEALVAAAPDVLIVTTSGLSSVGGLDGLLRIPGVAETPAGEHRRVFDFDDQMLLGFGPRTAIALEALLAYIHPELD